MALTGEAKKAYQRELMRKRRAAKEAQSSVVWDPEQKKAIAKPQEVTGAEWEYALERAERARRYAERMPDHVKPGEVRFQDPLWQWENEVKGRMPA